MLVICNGAAKSGSTWLYNIVNHLMEFQWPAQSYISQSNTKHPTIKEKYLQGFIDNEDLVGRDYVSKNHYGRPFHRTILLSSPNTRVIDMARDTRDVIVSSYYDSCRRSGFKGSFDDYYWQEGRLLVDYMKRYHDVWHEPHQQICLTSFEQLKQNFAEEVMKIAKFLDVEIDEQGIEQIYQSTNINSLRKSYQDDAQYNTEKNPFFRKGEVGDWQNHFSEKMIKDYKKINQYGLGRYDFIYVKNRLKEKLKSMFS